MKRLFEIFFSLIVLIASCPFIIFFSLIIFFEDRKSPIFIQNRLGKDKKLFKLFKLRTMKFGTESKGTHEISESSILVFGKIIRKLKIDELPQFLNVLLGDIEILGPRPCLPNQHELIIERDKNNLFDIKPGITGITQILGVMMDRPKLQASLDANYFRDEAKSIYFYFYCILHTIIKIDFNLEYLKKVCKIF